MFDVGWQVWFGLILVGIVVYFVLDAPSNPNSLGQNIVRLWSKLLDRLGVPEGVVPLEEARAERTERLRSQYPGLTDDAVAAFLLAQANALTAAISDGIKRLEARALALIGLAGAAVVLLSMFSPKGDATAPTALFEFALILLFCSIVVSAIALMPQRCRAPSVEIYNSLGTCENQELKAPITLELTEAVLIYNRKLQVVNVKKGRWQGAGIVLAVSALFFLLLNFHFGASSRPGAIPGHVNCPPNDPILCKRLDQ
ncbi:MAG TPA: hypothetical protein VGI15_06690 [Candidatus Cybelea sp.]